MNGPSPAALLYGPGHIVVHGNEPFMRAFGRACVGLPAAEGLVDLPRAAFELMDPVYRRGRPLARWIRVQGEVRRLVVVDRRDPETREVYGVALHLVARPVPSGQVVPGSAAPGDVVA